jgi:hypothetical protein
MKECVALKIAVRGYSYEKDKNWESDRTGDDLLRILYVVAMGK